MATRSKSTFDRMWGAAFPVTGFKRYLALLRLILLGLLLSIGVHSARADVWSFVDAKGLAHFAAEPLDDRYALLFQSEPDDTPDEGAAEASKVLAFFDIFPDYKAVKHHLREAALATRIDYELLQAVIATESGFNADAVSPSGATGLMQLMPATAAHFGVRGDKTASATQKLTNPGLNIRTGSRYLRYLLDLFPGQIDLALAAYNAGEGTVKRAGNQIPNIKQTQNYVKNVMALYTMLKPHQGLRLAPGSGQGVHLAWPDDANSRTSGGAATLPNEPLSNSSSETDEIQ
jgi:hypothetical protein